MTNYLIPTKNGIEHYFYRPYLGICVRKKQFGGIFSEEIPVIPSGGKAFSVYADGQFVHLACIDTENRLVYAAGKNGVFKKYILSKLDKNIFVSDMRLYSVGGRLNLLYSALYEGEYLLIHCIFAQYAKPNAVAKLENSHFFLYDNKAYFTDSLKRLGYVSLSDEKPSGFNFLYDNAHFSSFYRLSGRELLIYTKDCRLFVNNEEILYDSRMEVPCLVKSKNRTYVMWKSGSFIRYIKSDNGGITWSNPMRFISTGIAPTMYIMQEGRHFGVYYGYNYENDITLLGAPDSYLPENDIRSELESAKQLLNTSQEDLKAAEEEIARLKKIVGNIKFPSENS